MNIKELFSTSNLTTRHLGDKIGLSGSQVSQIANGKTEARPMLVKLCRYIFWKELGIPPEEILEELDLLGPSSGLAAETAAHYNKVDMSELEQKLQQLEDERRVLFATIDNLHKQLNK